MTDRVCFSPAKTRRPKLVEEITPGSQLDTVAETIAIRTVLQVHLGILRAAAQLNNLLINY